VHHAALPLGPRVDPLDGLLETYQTVGDEQQHPPESPMP